MNRAALIPAIARLAGAVKRGLFVALGSARRRPFAAVGVAIVLALFAAALWFLFPPGAPAFASVRAQWTPSDAYLLDRNGVVIDQQRLDFKARRFEWTRLDDVSPALLAAIIDGEDRRFWQHSGIDWSAVLGVLRDNAAQRRRGGSTISMQVVVRLDPSVRAGYSRGVFMRKLEQLRRVRALESTWTKQEILEAYVNLVGYRGELQGIAAASRVLAGKAPSGLTLPESLVLAALLPAPTAPTRRVATRACSRAAARHLIIDCASIRSAATALLGEDAPAPAAATALLREQATAPPGASNRDESNSATQAVAAALVRGGATELTAASARRRTDATSQIDASTPEAGFDPSAPIRNALAASSMEREPWAVHLAPHLARTLLNHAGQRATTTLDANIQRVAVETLRQHLANIANRNVRDGAVLVVDNESGDVLAYVGSAGPQSRAREVDGVRARRQAGSTLKPFLYELALERHYLTAASLLNDSPITLDTASGIYLPQNYDRDFKGLVSVRTALGSSLNVPAVRALMIVGVEPFRERLHTLGYAGITQPGEFYGYSLALGSAEVSLWEQVQAYRTLARGGQWSPISAQPAGSTLAEPASSIHASSTGTLTPTRPQTDAMRSVSSGGTPNARPVRSSARDMASRDVLAADASFIVGNIISDRAARVVTFGLDNHLNTPFWSAVKTGTSKDMRDNWCIGFSSRFTVGVWVGNFEGDSMHDVSGITGAAPVWHEIMTALHENVPSVAPTMPTGIVRTVAKFVPSVEAKRDEYFLKAAGVATSRPAPFLALARAADPLRLPEASSSHQARAADTLTVQVASDMARIASPSNGMVIAIDPDIPPQFQRVPLTARGADNYMVLKLNGKLLGSASSDVMWAPARGSYLLVLEDASGRTVDSAHFIVR